MNKEDEKWLEQLIKEKKESDVPLKYTTIPFDILYQLQQENTQLKQRILRLDSFSINLQTKYQRLVNAEPNYKIKKIYEDITYDIGNVDGVPNNIDSF